MIWNYFETDFHSCFSENGKWGAEVHKNSQTSSHGRDAPWSVRDKKLKSSLFSRTFHGASLQFDGVPARYCCCPERRRP